MDGLRRPKFLLILGYLFVAIAALLAMSDLISRLRTSYPLDVGVLAAGAAIAGVGVVAISVAKNLQRLEARIDQIHVDGK